MRRLESIEIENFRSIRHQRLELGSLNVFIGANGSGKSNLMQAFRLLHEVVRFRLRPYSLARGADRLLYRGRAVSPTMEFHVRSETSEHRTVYRLLLAPTDSDTLAVMSEEVEVRRRSDSLVPQPVETYSGEPGPESVLLATKEPNPRLLHEVLLLSPPYHFHDTGDTAAIRGEGAVDDNRFLRFDGSNLAAFLYVLQERYPDRFRRIEEAVRQVAPFFDRFALAPLERAPDRIKLEWREPGTDAYFDARSLSDGTLRFIALATVLLEPMPPPLILLDEPELGLHPAALALLADLLGVASAQTQVLVATQSATLVNHLEPADLWTVDREPGGGPTRFAKLGDKQDLGVWLESFAGYDGYRLGELWEKNVLGARP